MDHALSMQSNKAYGMVEMKKIYPGNMVKGTAISVLVHLILVGACYFGAQYYLSKSAKLPPRNILGIIVCPELPLPHIIAVQEPRPVTSVVPKYPPLAKQAGIEDVIYARMLIDTRGKVKEVVILKGNEIFHDAVKKAARAFVFTPAMREGEPVEYWLEMPFRFELP